VNPRSRHVLAVFLAAVVSIVAFEFSGTRNSRPVMDHAALATSRAASADATPTVPPSETGGHPLSHSASAFSTKPKLVHSKPEQVPDGNYAELLPDLKRKAGAGDAVAAYQIATMLEETASACSAAMTTTQRIGSGSTSATA
jgi:hypothetical protein